MLAGERFSDHPRCACPALTAFVRGYNDALDDNRRQDLFALASDLVGTRADEATSRARGRRLTELAWRYRRRAGLFRTGPVVIGTRFDQLTEAGKHLGCCARRDPTVHRIVLDELQALAAPAAPAVYVSRAETSVHSAV